MTIFTKPSFWTLPITGIIILYVYIKIMYDWDKLSKETTHIYFLMILLMFGILIGIHGLIHLGLEKNYSFNPLENIILHYVKEEK